MGYDFNQIRKPNAKLGKKTIDKLGTTFAIQYGLDGFSAVMNVVEPMPTDIKEYLEGNDDITIFACASNIDKLCEYALASFPNIEDLYLFKTSEIVVLDDDLSYLLHLNKIYVPSDLLSAYISAYPTLSSKFDTIVEDYTLTIPYVGIANLTSDYIDSVIAMLSVGQKESITKVVVPSEFIESVANQVIWGYNFSQYLPNLNNNIWYNTTQYDFSEFTIAGSGTLTSDIVDSSIAGISSDKVSGVTKIVVPVEFTSINDYCFDIADTTLTNNITIQLNGTSPMAFSKLSTKLNERDNTTKIKTIYTNCTSSAKGMVGAKYQSTGSTEMGTQIIFNALQSLNNELISWSPFGFERIFFASLTNISVTNILAYYPPMSYPTKKSIMFVNNQSAMNLKNAQQVNFGNMVRYSNAKYLAGTIEITTQSASYQVGVIDGNDVYIDKGFSYPKLSSTLTIDTTNGHLMDSGVDLFDGYTATWYSDEDCTTTIQPSAITSDMTVYVKLS